MSNTPKTLADFPQYVQAKEQNLALRVELNEAKRQLEVAKNSAANQETPSAVELQARKLLAGDAYSDAETPTEVSKLRKQIEILETTVRMSDQKVAEEKAKASKEIALSWLPDHVGNVLAVAKLLPPLVDALKAEEALRRSLESQDVGYSGYIRPMQLMGTAGRFQSLAEAFIEEAKANGLA